MATKDDEKKKLFILLGLLGVAAVVVLFMYVIRPAMQDSGGALVSVQVTETVNPLSPFEVDTSLAMPPVGPLPSFQVRHWPEETAGGRYWAPRRGEAMPYDPLRIQNIDVVDPGRREHLDRIRSDWRLVGITETWRWVTVLDEQGEPVLNENGDVTREYRKVWEAFFEGRTRPLGENDRLPGTRFTIEEIRITPERAFVRLRGDTGAELDLELAPLD
jgi:hypothetical protein